MGQCDRCPGNGRLSFTCNHCGGEFCSDHRLPEAHGCTELRTTGERWPTKQGKRPSKSGLQDSHSPVSTVAGIALTPFVVLYVLLSTVASYGIWIISHVRLLGVAAVVLVTVSATVGTGFTPLDRTVGDAVDVGSQVVDTVSSTAADATSTDRQELRMAIHERINEIRTDRGLPSLTYSEQLEDVAQYHSDDMAERDYFSHDSPDGDGMRERYRRLGAPCRAGGENIYTSTSSTADEDAFAAEVVSSWMSSPGHRSNILEGRWRAEALGIAEGNGATYVTQNFC